MAFYDNDPDPKGGRVFAQFLVLAGVWAVPVFPPKREKPPGNCESNQEAYRNNWDQLVIRPAQSEGIQDGVRRFQNRECRNSKPQPA